MEVEGTGLGGLFRLILAVAVILDHTAVHDFYGFRLINPGFAVQAFFMLSGFYMALVLDRTYHGPAAYRVFLENRIMRLYPMYWLILALTIPVVFVGANFVELPAERPVLLYSGAFVYPQLVDFPAFVLLLFSHVAIIGQDVIYFLAVDPSGLYGIGEYPARQAAQHTSLPLRVFLFVPQAWSLSFEMLFYAMAPFLMRRSTPTIAALMALSLALRMWMLFGTNLMEGGNSAWPYKFFPNEFWTFMAGILMYRVYRLIEARNYPTVRLIWAPAALIGVGLFGRYVPLADGWPFFVAIAVLVPVAFQLFSQRRDLAPRPRWFIKIDRFLGDLSYPVYISHVFVLYAIYTFFPRMTLGLGNHLTPIVVIVTLVFSTLLLRFAGEPIDRLRARNRERLDVASDRATRRRGAMVEQRHRGRRGATRLASCDRRPDLCPLPSGPVGNVIVGRASNPARSARRCCSALRA